MSKLGYNLRPLWDVLLDVYLEIQAICERHHLRYYACGGTALGAVRHGGAIPWDDDFDLFMPRPDYMRFVELAQLELPKYLSCSSIHDNQEHIMPFGKVAIDAESKVPFLKKSCGLQLGEAGKLIVAVSTDRFNWVEKYKRCAISDRQRMEIVGALKCVDQVIPAVNWVQKKTNVAKYGVGIFAMGDDWKGKFNFLKELCQVIYLPRTPGISSTQLKADLKG